MQMQNITKITLAWELNQAEINKQDIAKRLEVNRDTVRLWLKGIEEHGLIDYLDRYACAKKGPRKARQVNPVLKRWVWDIRVREFDCCGQKIAYFLEQEHGVRLSVPKIYEIIKERFVVKSKWKKNQKRGHVSKASEPREVIEMDTVDFGGLFAFTGIDIYTREVDVMIAPALTSEYGYIFLRKSMKRRFDGHVQLLQTDGGHEFKSTFKHNVNRFCDRHRIARPYKKNEQAHIESFNRSLRKECLGWTKYQKQEQSYCTDLVERFLDRYHYHRPHMGLGMRPPLLKH
ncbi:hypothetical protein COY14_04020 [Candidatus Roizmanbacteria bacterium CG_4_10_14_0_2_um_filter_36_9]|uniref:Integrase catalytic domain-containing protein n=1 Tax=Candidatus Roizmanbacteria bacterium CG_4_10_14_0_2_um_filter_36_9 TaxID=1974823 RepID=A0A2M7U3E9_9BACT|nr:MAG: hypothetical protein COY14_04020 [Candidatus Roizmanbacteria bacterium CG_4_10_14_0_2_um_filter_36_9]